MTDGAADEPEETGFNLPLIAGMRGNASDGQGGPIGEGGRGRGPGDLCPDSCRREKRSEVDLGTEYLVLVRWWGGV